MVKAFDPYHKWLGIAPHDQPPSHYRLLGLESFEDDADVIEAAADRQMAHLRTFQSGKHGDSSQKLLNEVAAARVCLSDPDKKSAYDRQLRDEEEAKLKPVPAAAPPKAPPPKKPKTDAEAQVEPDRPIDSVLVDRRVSGRHSSHAGNRSFGLILIVGGLAAVVMVLLLGGVLFWTLLPDRAPERRTAATEPVERQRDVPGSADPSDPKDVPSSTIPDKGEGDPEQPVVDPGPNELPPDEGDPEQPVIDLDPDEVPPDEGEGDPDPAVVEPPPDEPESSFPAPKESPIIPPEVDEPLPKPETGDKPKAPREKPPQKFSIPTDVTRRKLRAALDDVFKFDRARKPAEKLELANDLFAQGKKLKGKSDERFVFLHAATDMAGEGGDTALLVEIVDAIAADFDVDALGVKEKMLVKSAAHATTKDAVKSFMEVTSETIEDALAEQRFDLAKNLADRAYRRCQQANGKEFRKQAYDLRTKVQKAAQSCQQYQDALTALQTDPDDPKAHLAMGWWYCVEQADWEQGLPHLIKGDDDRVKALAQREVDSPPAETADRIALADDWWSLAMKKKEEQKDASMRRAGHWYEKAQGELTSNLDKTRVAKRLAEIEKIGASKIAPRRTRKIAFVAGMSMRPYPPGSKQMSFPTQTTADPRGPFAGQPVYFQQKTGKNVVYEIQWHPPVRQIYYRGAAWKNMTIEVLNSKGAVLARTGPHGGGNKWSEVVLNLPPNAGNRFFLRFHNEISTWFFIARVEFR